MAQTIADITVDATAWVDLNTTSGIAVGTKFSITNKGTHWVRLYEGTTAPVITVTDGEVLTTQPHSTSSSLVLAGSLKIWALCADTGASSKLSVQELT
jgi:hypothetical protein